MPEPTPEAWAQIRHDYEHTDRPLAHICDEHEITAPMLRYRMKKWDWTRRKPPIPREGPPAVAASADGFLHPPLEGEGEGEAAPYHSAPPPPGEGKEEAPANAASIVPRLRSAIARVLPAIEATIARLAEGPQRPRDLEQAGRALSSLTRTLRELNALLAEQMALAAEQKPPHDIDAFRYELARRIRGIVAARRQASGQTSGEAKAQET